MAVGDTRWRVIADHGRCPPPSSGVPRGRSPIKDLDGGARLRPRSHDSYFYRLCSYTYRLRSQSLKPTGHYLTVGSLGTEPLAPTVMAWKVVTRHQISWDSTGFESMTSGIRGRRPPRKKFPRKRPVKKKTLSWVDILFMKYCLVDMKYIYEKHVTVSL